MITYSGRELPDRHQEAGEQRKNGNISLLIPQDVYKRQGKYSEVLSAERGSERRTDGIPQSGMGIWKTGSVSDI